MCEVPAWVCEKQGVPDRSVKSMGYQPVLWNPCWGAGSMCKTQGAGIYMYGMKTQGLTCFF